MKSFCPASSARKRTILEKGIMDLLSITGEEAEATAESEGHMDTLFHIRMAFLSSK